MEKWVNTLEYRKALGLDKLTTFGIEIEFADGRFRYVSNELQYLFSTNKISKPWQLTTEETLYETLPQYTRGGEAVSPILIDEENTWNDIKEVCKAIKKYNGIITDRCGGHIHIGSNVLEDNIDYYIRLAKLWTIYEDVIVKFGYGEDENAREYMFYFASSAVPMLKYIDMFEKKETINGTFEEFVKGYSIDKNQAISFRNLSPETNINTIEIRCPNGTLNPVIWQNNINFFTKLLLACKDDSKDWDSINKKFEEFKNNEFDLLISDEDAIDLADFVFNDLLDKINFLKQYKKNQIIKPNKQLIR